jgi:hypothetical protein
MMSGLAPSAVEGLPRWFSPARSPSLLLRLPPSAFPLLKPFPDYNAICLPLSTRPS